MESKTATSARSISFFGLLGIVFIVLKLCGVIAWSWWWVTAPLWGGAALVIAAILTICVLAIVTGLCQGAVKGIGKAINKTMKSKES